MTTTPLRPNCEPTPTKCDDEKGFGEVFAELVTLLVRLRFIAEVAEDAAQEALIRDWEWESAGKTAELRDRAAWRRSVAINRARTMIARECRYKVLEVAELVEAPSDDLRRTEEADALMQAIANLPENLRFVFIACAVEGKTYQEVARDLGLRPGAVNGRLFRARRIIRSELRARGFEIETTKKSEMARATGLADSLYETEEEAK